MQYAAQNSSELKNSFLNFLAFLCNFSIEIEYIFQTTLICPGYIITNVIFRSFFSISILGSAGPCKYKLKKIS